MHAYPLLPRRDLAPATLCDMYAYLPMYAYLCMRTLYCPGEILHLPPFVTPNHALLSAGGIWRAVDAHTAQVRITLMTLTLT